MTLRFCPRCSADVETAEGFCFLGHSVKLLPLAEPQEGYGGGPPLRPPRSAGSAPPPPPPGKERRPAAPLGRFGALWGDGDRDRPTTTDPIATFAPYPRMDWGPRRPWRRSGFGRAGD